MVQNCRALAVVEVESRYKLNYLTCGPKLLVHGVDQAFAHLGRNLSVFMERAAQSALRTALNSPSGSRRAIASRNRQKKRLFEKSSFVYLFTGDRHQGSC